MLILNCYLPLVVRLLQKVAQDVVSSMTVLERLQKFEYKDPNGRDHVSLVACIDSAIDSVMHGWIN